MHEIIDLCELEKGLGININGTLNFTQIITREFVTLLKVSQEEDFL